MIEFKNFLTESLDVEKLKHLEHVEDHIIHGGHAGVEHAADTMNDIMDFMTGKPTKTKITTKWDGAPSIVFGINPDNGKFFVATKSAFNKQPKLAYNDEDIQMMYGHSEGLANKLKAALKMLPKIMPKKGGVFQGDLMYGAEDLDDKDNSLSFTPNTVTYTVDKDSEQGKKVADSKLGIVVHTQYVGKKGHHTSLANMVADFGVNQNAFQQSPEVNVINPEVKKPPELSTIQQRQINQLIEKATGIYRNMDHDAFEGVDKHQDSIKMYINKCIKEDTPVSAKGFRDFIAERGQKDIDKLKSEKVKATKQQALEETLSELDQNKKQFDSFFKLHKTLQQAKDTMVDVLARGVDTGYKTSMGGKPTKPEGFVAIRNGRPSKLVDRAEFSRQNFLAGSFRKNEEQQVETENSPKNPIVFAFGRMNPPTSGHGALVDKVKELAKENKAKHLVVLSRSQDPEDNPLDPETKLQHAKRFFPGTNIQLADQDALTFIEQAKKLSKQGHDHLIMVAGSDRVEDYKKILDQYNGKEYNFKKIDVVSAGQRDPDAKDEEEQKPIKGKKPAQKPGVQHVSATKQRQHAIANRFSEFKKGLPSHVHPDHARQLFNDVRRGMDIKIDENTSGISLARYAKRNDPIGVKARREVERRQRLKEQEKKSKQAKKPAKKPIKEEMNVDAIRGLGYVTGDPMVDVDFQQAWTSLNQSEADTRDQVMNMIKGIHHDKHHADLEKKMMERRKFFVKTLLKSIKDKTHGSV